MATNSENDVFVDQECRLVLIGKQASGKSCTGNTILGRNVFKVQTGLNCVKKQCFKAAGVRGDLKIIVTDTPGLWSIDDDDEIIMNRITKSMMAARSGPHAILLVLRCDARFTTEEAKVYGALKDSLGHNMTDFLIILFNGKDNMDNDLFEKQLKKSDKLNALLSENGNRYILFNNNATGPEQDEQVNKLLAMVRGVARNNRGACFRLADQMDSATLDQVYTKQSAGPEPDSNNYRTDRQLFPTGRCRLILIGKTGAGKSSTGNAILGETKFGVQTGINSETKECGVELTERSGLQLLLVDTPGLCDTDGEEDNVSKEITNSLLAVHPGPHAIILVLKCDARFTQEELKVYTMLKDLFGPAMTEYLVTVFTGKDQINISEFYEQLEKSERLSSVLEETGHRHVLFNNNPRDQEEREQQVDELLVKVRQVVRHSNGKCFRHKLHSELDLTMTELVKEEFSACGDKDNARRSTAAAAVGPSEPITMTELVEGKFSACSVKDQTKVLTASAVEGPLEPDGIISQDYLSPSLVSPSLDAATKREEEKRLEVENNMKRDLKQKGPCVEVSEDPPSFTTAEKDAYRRKKEAEHAGKIALVKQKREHWENLSRPKQLLDKEALPASNESPANQPPKTESTNDQPLQVDTRGQNSLGKGHLVDKTREGLQVAGPAAAALRKGEEEEEPKPSEAIRDAEQEHAEKFAVQLMMDEEDLDVLLEHLLGVLGDKIDGLKELSLPEKHRLLEDSMRTKVIKRPDTLTRGQQEILDTSVRSVDDKVKKGMTTFSLKTVVKCSVM